MEEKKFYEQAWFAWVVLILFAPVGIVFMWRYKHHGVIGRTLASVFFGCLFIVVVAEQVGIKDKASGAEAAGEGATETVEDGTDEDDEGSLDESSDAGNDDQTGDAQSDNQTENGTDGEDEEDGKDLVEVVLDEKISITDDQVTIKGKTNLEDGAILSYIVTHLENEDELVRGELTVKDGKFKVKKDISHFANGEIYAYLVFRPEKQDETIQETYGEQGQYMIGDKVTADNDDEDVNIVAAESLYEKVKPIVREGTGDQATKPFELSSGFAVFEADHQGGSNFIVHLLDENGDKKDFLINEIGTYKGKTLALIPADGKYLLNVDADGPWHINVTQNVPAEYPVAPTKIEGVGDSVVFVELEDKLTTFTSKHSGESNFIVRVDGDNLLVNEIGHYEGSVAKKVGDRAVYIISVHADGKWEIAID